MTHIFDIFEKTEYEQATALGHIRTQRHPTDDLVIHNYTPGCQWEKGWNTATMACRGLITRTDGAVIARPFPKFFNYGDPLAPTISLDDEVQVFEKFDGSLAVLHKASDGWAIATRGSFTSDQAIWATAFWRKTYPDFVPMDGLTYLFEIIYPANRIVVDYGDREDLVFLGAIKTSSGVMISPDQMLDQNLPFSTVAIWSYGTLAEVLAAPERSNAEGFVVWNPETGERVKIKYEEYKRLHKFMTMVTPKHVWECLSAGRDLEVEFAGAPDEFHEWVRKVADDLTINFNLILDDVTDRYNAFVSQFGKLERKDFAEAVKSFRDKALWFVLYDERSIDQMIWRTLKPSRENTVRQVNSDAD